MKKINKISWHKEFSIKNADLDKQHEMIFEITNDAHELAIKIKEKNFDEKEKESLKTELKDLTYRLFEYIKVHFRDEEKYMKEIEFPLIEDHIKAHRDLVNKTKAVLAHSNDMSKFIDEFTELTNTWILDHFVNGDAWIEN